MRRALLCAAVWIAAATISASTRIIPVASHLPGANGTVWTTDVSLTNKAGSAAIVDLVFHPDDGIVRTRSLTLGRV